MLDDRKFYFEINSKPEPQPAGGSNPMRERMRYKKWRPVGPDEFVTMDSAHAFVGEHSPEIKLEGATAHGIEQSGLALRKGKAYVGRIILMGTPGEGDGQPGMGRKPWRSADDHDPEPAAELRQVSAQVHRASRLR
jgi:hypothetical protein